MSPAPISLAFALAAAASAMPAAAQVFRNHDSNAPVNFAADRIEVQDRADRVVVSGNVNVTQAGLNLTSQRMTVAYRNGGGQDGLEIDRIDASGNVVVTKGRDVARGNVAIYDLNRRIITMLGNVQLNQGVSRLSGGRLVIDLNTGRSTVDGRASPGSAPGITGGAGGRVSGTFSVPKRNSP